MKKTRRVMVTLELETAVVLRDLRNVRWWQACEVFSTVVQAQANVIRQTKTKRRPRSKRRSQ